MASLSLSHSLPHSKLFKPSTNSASCPLCERCWQICLCEWALAVSIIDFAGRSIVLPLLDQWQKVDLRNRAFSVPPQHIFTCDGGVVALGCDVLFRVKKPVLAVTEIQNLDTSTRALAQVALMKMVRRRQEGKVSV